MEPRHGPLPALLLAMTVVTGLVDAFSYLDLGRVLVANMTGNVVFLGFALGEAPGFVWWASLIAIGAFLAGAFAGGRLGSLLAAHRGRFLAAGAGLELALVVAALVVTLVADDPYADAAKVLLIVLLGAALGLQNATARRLAVPDLTTTVLTLTLTGIAADSVAAGGSGSRLGRRLVPVATMFAGGLIGALLVVGGHGTADLAIAAALLAVVTAVAARAAASAAPWTAFATHWRAAR